MLQSEKMKSAEWLSAIIIAAWGFFLLMPGESYLRDNTYGPFLKVASEQRWGLVAVAIGIFHMVALRAHHRCAFGREGRIIAVVYSMIWWGLVSAIRFSQDAHAPNWLTSLIVMATMGLSLFYLIREKPELAHDTPVQHRDPEPHQEERGSVSRSVSVPGR
jgi:hypothetical protein